MKTILVTGVRGFIGFNAVRLWKSERPQYRYVGLDACTYADRMFQVEKDEWLDANGVPRFVLDLASPEAAEALDGAVRSFGIDAVAHFAAESHVDRSISGPGAFYRSNVMGTAAVMEAARRNGLRVHVVSTDEVYGETRPADWEAGRPPLRPSSPYSASKAAADLIALSYARTYGTAVTVSRCSNNFGPWQHVEKLIGSAVTKAVRWEQIPVYGDGGQRRHWIYVDEHNRAVMRALEEGEPGGVYDVAPPAQNWLSNMDIVEFVLRETGRPPRLVRHVADRPGHDASYFMSAEGLGRSAKCWKEDMA